MHNEEIILAELSLVEAIKTSNAAILNNMLHPDLLFITPDGSVVTKHQDLEAHRSGAMVVQELKPKVEKVNIIDADTAVSITVYDTKGIMLGNAIEGRFRYIRVWKKFNGTLKVVGGSCTALN